MQTLYGMKITDRVTVDEIIKFGLLTYRARFDGEHVGDFTSGRDAVSSAIAFIKRKRAEAEAFAANEAAMAAETQECEDEAFLTDIANRLGVDASDLDRLIEIVARRSAS